MATKLQKAINPASWESLLKDKGIFYRFLMAQGLPIPQLYGIFFQKVPGWSPNGSILVGRADWERLLATIPADEFVIKPCRGAFGSGIKIFARTSGGFKDISGNMFKAVDIYNLMRTDTDFDAFVVQQRLRNHPEIYRLNPSEFLQTVRVTTFIDRRGCCQILFAFMKLIGGSNIADNFGDGRNGNMLAAVLTEDGNLEPAVVTDSQGRGARCFNIHPLTGVEFSDFHIPRWAEVTAMAKKAAVHFLPVRTIGWDIAVTPTDIKIVEGNVWWNPLNRCLWKDVIEAELPYDF
jgi:Sugar-transfer associated ATP-grasp